MESPSDGFRLLLAWLAKLARLLTSSRLLAVYGQ